VVSGKLAPQMLPTKSGSMLCNDTEFIFSLQIFVFGKKPEEKDFVLIARQLARMHSCLAKSHIKPFRNHLENKINDIAKAALDYGYDRYVDLIAAIERVSSQGQSQIVHGDPHTSNIVVSEGRVLFLDFDTSHFSYPESDVAVASFRLCSGQKRLMERFIEHYNKVAQKPVEFKMVIRLLVKIILQRIFFILTEKDHGRTQWMGDLENQKRYLHWAMQLLDE
jgi:Ser/Thr protein kinase RdoA (MazF antagonist)